MTNQAIRHVVLLKFRADTSTWQIEDLWQGLHKLRSHIPEMGIVHAGKSCSPEQIERGYLHGFSIDFTSLADLQTYLDHPQHKAFGGRLLNSTAGGIDGVLVFDLPLSA